MPSNVVTPTGDRYFVAVKFTDNCSKLNINTATSAYDSSGASSLVPPNAPCNIDLPRGLVLGDAGMPNRVAGNRASNFTVPISLSTGSNTMIGYNANCALQVLDPSGYTPYSIADEAYLNYYKPGGPTEIGRLFNALTNNNTLAMNSGSLLQLRRELTTYSASRPLLRHPDFMDDGAFPRPLYPLRALQPYMGVPPQTTNTYNQLPYPTTVITTATWSTAPRITPATSSRCRLPEKPRPITSARRRTQARCRQAAPARAA